MVADRVGRPDDALGGRLAHAMAGVEHPVDSGDADAGGPREIGDGRAAAHGVRSERFDAKCNNRPKRS